VVLLEKQKIYKNNHRDEYREYQNEYRKNRRLRDVDFKLTETIRSHIHRTFKFMGCVKKSKTFDIVDYTPQELNKHLEGLLIDGMTW